MSTEAALNEAITKQHTVAQAFAAWQRKNPRSKDYPPELRVLAVKAKVSLAMIRRARGTLEYRLELT